MSSEEPALDSVAPAKVRLEYLMVAMRNGMITGKPRIAIIPLLLPVFAAIAEIIVRITANPIEPIRTPEP